LLIHAYNCVMADRLLKHHYRPLPVSPTLPEDFTAKSVVVAYMTFVLLTMPCCSISIEVKVEGYTIYYMHHMAKIQIIILILSAAYINLYSSMYDNRKLEGQHPLPGQRAANLRLLANQ